MRPMNRGNHAQVVLLKRKRNEEPLDGLLLEMNSRNMSDLDLARQTAENSADDEAGEDEDVTVKDSIRARKRKKVASSRGFFQLAETVEKAKWDDEAWRRDFNERVLAKSKEGKKALAAAAGVEVALDSPVVEKAQPLHPPSPAKPARKYTAVLQVRPKPEDLAAASKGKQKQTVSSSVTASSESLKGAKKVKKDSARENLVPDAESVLYFDAVPVGLSAKEERRAREAKRAQEEEDEIAAFLPMLQDYLRINDIGPAKILPEKPKEINENLGSNIHARQESAANLSASDDEYVYDVYFKGNTEPTASDWNNLGNYGTLVGLPLDSKGSDDDSDGGEDYSDEDEDDDSNAEEFYRNDYPDEQDEYSDSDDSDGFYDDRDDSADEEDYDDDTRWR